MRTDHISIHHAAAVQEVESPESAELYEQTHCCRLISRSICWLAGKSTQWNRSVHVWLMAQRDAFGPCTAKESRWTCATQLEDKERSSLSIEREINVPPRKRSLQLKSELINSSAKRNWNSSPQQFNRFTFYFISSLFSRLPQQH